MPWYAPGFGQHPHWAAPGSALERGFLAQGWVQVDGAVPTPDAPVDPAAARLVRAINGKLADITGGITLTAGDVGALDQTAGDDRYPRKGDLVLNVKDYGAVPATVIPDAATTASSTTVTSPGGHFTPAMTGQYVHIPEAGPLLATASAYAWQASPLVGTLTYVSATQGTLSVAATRTVVGSRMLVGPDATTAIEAALAAGNAVLPRDTDFLIAGEIDLGSGRALRGEERDTSRLVAVTPNNSLIISALTVEPRVANLTVVGTGYGTQPANVTPTPGQAPNLANSGCGVVFAGVTRGKIENVAALHCGGDITTGHNGIAGIYVTFGCVETVVSDCYAAYCRNGINEDNFFNNTADQPPFYNTFSRNVTEYCAFGISIDSGANTRGASITDHVARYCKFDGIDVHRSRYTTITSPRCEFNGSNFSGNGIIIYGDSASVTCEHVTITGAMCFGNGQSGIKFSDYVKDAKVIGGIAARNFRHGVFINNNCTDITVTDTTARNNGMGTDNPGEYDGLRIVSSQRVLARVRAFDDQTTATQNWGVRATGTADDIVVDDASRIYGNKVGPISLVGVASRVGAKNRDRLTATTQGLSGETFPRASAGGSFTPAAGDQRATLVGLLAGELVTNIWLHVTVAGTGVTLAKVGIWDAAGNLLGASPDLSSQLNAGTGVKGGALTAPYRVPADGGYYIGVVTVGGTSPTLLRGTSGITGYTGQPVGAGAPPSVGNTGKTDIGAMALTASGNAPWGGWS